MNSALEPLNPPRIDRLALRTRPTGGPLLKMQWVSLLFAHWPISADLLRPLVPRRLEIDTHAGEAWIGVVPFTMRGVRARCLPPLPGVAAFHEVNVRTYVHLGGAPGVYFFSLDAANPLAVVVARRSFHLRYFHAKMSMRLHGEVVQYRSSRAHRGAAAAGLEASWAAGEELPESRPGSIEFFLTERYCLYASPQGSPDRILRCRIHHAPWRLRRALLARWRSTMVESLGLPEPRSSPLLHHADHTAVDVWAPRLVDRA